VIAALYYIPDIHKKIQPENRFLTGKAKIRGYSLIIPLGIDGQMHDISLRMFF